MYEPSTTIPVDFGGSHHAWATASSYPVIDSAFELLRVGGALT
jgi:hypothetical protein